MTIVIKPTPKVALFLHLMQGHSFHGGPDRVALIDATYINRTRTLDFDCFNEFDRVQIRALYSTRNDDQFFVIGRGVNAQRRFQHVLFGYDVGTRWGSWAPIRDELSCSDLLGHEGMPSDEQFQYKTTVFDDYITSILETAPGKTMAPSELAEKAGLEIPRSYTVLTSMRNRGKLVQTPGPRLWEYADTVSLAA